jgi:hypothetical protein
VKLGASDEARVRERDRPIREFLQQLLDPGPVILRGDGDGVDATRSQRDDLGRPISVHLAHQEARFGDDRFTTAKGRLAGGELAARTLVVCVGGRQQRRTLPDIGGSPASADCRTPHAWAQQTRSSPELRRH